jgi:O-acetyl-ADP-ribose deacetylase (regulator of RNase III)
LTGNTTRTGEFFSVEKYHRGGMSGGMVSCTFWEQKAIPLFVSRYRLIRNWTKVDELKFRIDVIQGNITTILANAIVNAANTSLLGGGGVDGAIHRAGGPDILEDCRKIVARQGGCKTGEAVITRAGKLHARKVIHTVGPVWNGGNNNEALNLGLCYTNSLKLAEENDCRTVAFPCISTGIYRFPIEQAAKIAVETISSYLVHSDKIDRVTIVCFDETNYAAIKNELDSIV